MPNEIDPALLARYLAGRTTPDEDAHVQAWLEAHPERRLHLEGLDALATAAPPDPEQALNRILRRSTPAVSPTAHPPRVPQRAPDRSIQRRQPGLRYAPFVRVAAVLVGLAVLVVVARALMGSEASFRTVTTQPGERTTLTLADGTVVELNVDSRLRLPETFAAAQREVWLDGEAFFDVASDAARPFRIHTGEAVVEVLGTAFSVMSYPGTSSPGVPEVVVVVQEGRVALRSATSPDTGAVLAPGHRGALAAGRLTIDAVDPADHLAWRHGRLVFEGTPLTEVARTLARWYAVDVHLSDDAPATLRLDASFDDEPLADVLATIAAVLPVAYRVEGGTVTLSRPSARP